MNIAMFTDSFLPNINGVVTSVVNSSKELAKKGNKILIFTVKTKNDKNISLHKNIKIIRFSPLNLIKNPDFSLVTPKYFKCIKLLKKFKPDVIHIHIPSLLGWCGLIASKILNIPSIGTYHTFLPDFLEYLPFPNKINRSNFAKNFAWKYTRTFYNQCNIVTTPSIAMKKELIKHGIIKPVIFISNGVNLNRFKPLNIKKDGKTILHVGRISYEKNINIIIKAFKLLIKKDPTAELLIVGRGPDSERLKKESGNLLDKNIKFLGPIKHEDLPKIYSKADIFVTASTIETEGLVILEAMACGLPIIGVNKLAIPYIVKHNKNGFLAKPGSYKEIFNYLHILLNNKGLRENMSKNSLNIVKNFSLEKTINKLKEIYKNER